jgi:hypothetical protein
MLGLKGYSKLSDMSLKSVAVSTEEGVPLNEKITFSITAKADLLSGATTGSSATSDTTSTSTSSNTTNSTTQGTATTTP